MTTALMYKGEEKNISILGISRQECLVDSEFRYTLFTVYYSIIFILGFLSNCYVLWIFTRVYATKKLNEIKIFMVNLTTADLLFLVTLPMWIVYYHHKGDWIMPDFLCNVGGYLFFVNTYCSVAFLGVITYNRYQAVTKPITAAQSSTRRRGIYVTLAIWILIAVPAIYFLVDEGTTEEVVKGRTFKRCFERYDPNSDIRPVLGFHVLICVCFFITFLLVLVCNTFIIRTLLSQPVQARKSTHIRQRALWMVCTVLTVFIVCFVPHHVLDLPWTLMVLQAWKINCRTQQLVNDLHQVTLLFLGANCVLDPVIYCFLTKKFRKHLSENLHSILCQLFYCSRVLPSYGSESPRCPLSDAAATIHVAGVGSPLAAKPRNCNLKARARPLSHRKLSARGKAGTQSVTETNKRNKTTGNFEQGYINPFFVSDRWV